MIHETECYKSTDTRNWIYKSSNDTRNWML